MVHVSTPRPSLGAALGNALGGIGGKIAGQEYGRYQTRQGLDKLRQSSQNASPIDQLYNLIEASNYSPQIGKAMGPLYETLLRNQNASNAPNALDVATGDVGSQGNFKAPTSDQPQPQSQMQPQQQFQPSQGEISSENQKLPTQKTGTDVQSLSNKFLQQTRPDLFMPSSYGNIPTFDTQTKSALRPQEESQIRKDLNAQKISPEQQDQVIAKINQDIGARYQEKLKNYDILQGQQNSIDTKWNQIQKDSPTLLAPFIGGFGEKTQQILRDKFNQYAESQPVNQTPQAVEAQAMTLLQRDLNQLNALSTLPAMPPVRQWSDIKSYMEGTKKAYAPLKGEGWDQALLEDAINNKDMGIEEAHEAIYGDQTNQKNLQSIGNVKKGKDDQQYISNVAKQLKNLGPNDDLILARTMVLGNDGTIQDFVNALDLAQKEGLELSPFQQSQLQEIQIPRQQPLYEIFSPGKSPSPGFSVFGIPGMVFGHFFNYLRGKK